MPSVKATPAAVETIGRLRQKHGPIVIHQSAGCCAGSVPMCLTLDELPPGAGDLELGEVAGAPFVIDAELHRRLGSPDFLLDVAPGREDTFSLEGADDIHFTTRLVPVDAATRSPAQAPERTSDGP